MSGSDEDIGEKRKRKSEKRARKAREQSQSRGAGDGAEAADEQDVPPMKAAVSDTVANKRKGFALVSKTDLKRMK